MVSGKEIDLPRCCVHCVLIRNQSELPGRMQEGQDLDAFFGGESNGPKKLLVSLWFCNDQS